MVRRIIHIDEALCTGCGLCVQACHEGAIELIDGKAKLTREHYCDGLGDCLPQCPAGAIRFEEREAPAYDEAAVLAGKQAKAAEHPTSPSAPKKTLGSPASQLRQWPTQIKLMPISAPYYQGARLLIAADCTAFAYAAMHQDFIRDHIAIHGCPKLDNVDYADKLAKILCANDIREITVVRMEVPCCGGLQMATKRAIEACGKSIPWNTVIISVEGNLL